MGDGSSDDVVSDNADSESGLSEIFGTVSHLQLQCVCFIYDRLTVCLRVMYNLGY